MIGMLRKLQKLISKFPSKARAPHSPPAQYQRSQDSPQPQHSTSKARAPHSPPAQHQQSQGSPQPPSTVPAKPGLPTVPQHSTSKARAPHSSTSEARAPTAPQCSTSHQGPSQGLPASLQCQKKLPATRDHHRDCLPLPSARRSSQPPGTITGTACLSPAPEEAPNHQGPSQGLPASPQCQKKLPATRDHHRACLSSVNIHWIFIHSNWKHHD